MKKTILLTAFLLLLSLSYAQQVTTGKKSLVLDGVVKMEQIEEREPLPYPAINESDIFKYIRVWRVLDLRERLNYPLYYPIELSQKRKSFIQALVGALEQDKIKVYDTGDDEFTAEMSLNDVLAKFDAEDRTITRRTLDDRDTTYTVQGEINWREVQELLIKEDWYFDKRRSRLQVRIIGICPVRVYARELRTGEEEEIESELLKRPLFWIYYPDARKVLANTACFINENELAIFSFDDLFQNRRFTSYISAMSNAQGNRRVLSYTRTGKEALLESRQLENELMNFESDLWEW
ncbi:MAG: gliding motility protein GldN [Bacteroidales bacterium]|nr:gliding motility protein GldN [Bacteroidales bacterium]MCL2132936.1 gliding motility protein GldN [Bacteroidales bacterium]